MKLVDRLANQDGISADEYASMADETIQLGRIADKANEGHDTQEVVQLARGVLEDGLAAVQAGRQYSGRNLAAWQSRERVLRDLLARLKQPPHPPQYSPPSPQPRRAHQPQPMRQPAQAQPSAGMQRIGGTTESTTDDTATADAQERLAELRGKENPGELFRRMQTRPQATVLHDW